jgi:peptide/nickel transport system permease protein
MADNTEKNQGTNEMLEDVLEKEASAQGAADDYSLNDDRRVKTLSPTALVVKRFLRNRVAVTGLIILAFMFVFSFVGGIVSPYREDQLFYRTDSQNKQ